MKGPAPSFFARLQAACGRVAGWRRALLAAALGALSVFALPPGNLVFLLIPAFTGLFWLIDQRESAKGALIDGWWFGFGFFAVGLYWISFAFLVKPEQFAWMIPVAVFGFSGFLALFPAAASALYRTTVGKRVSPRTTEGAGRVLVFAALWTAAEWVRGWILTGFPWNLIGTAWSFSDAMLQTAALTGVYGLSLLTVSIAAMPAVLGFGDSDGNRGRRPVIAAALILALVWTGGAVRLASADGGEVPGVRFRLVQPNIDQKIKWLPELRDRHIVTQARMSLQPPQESDLPTPTHVIWAEAAAPLFLARSQSRLALVGQAAPIGGQVITGAIRADKVGRIYNSLHAIGGDGKITATYDKSHLVPFGEYVPFREILKFAKVTPGGRDYSAGPGPTTLRIPGLPTVSPLICYEAVFSGRVVDASERPHWLLNLTNDGWYGRTAGPYQHFTAARMRAVEEGLPLVRVANTGISGVVDAYGRVTASLGLGRIGVVDAGLPRRLEKQTPYGALGDWMTVFLIALTGGAGWLLSGKTSR